MPIPERVRNRRFYFTAEELPEEARTMLAKMLTVQLQSEYGDAPDRSGAVCPTVEDKTWLDLQLSQEKEHGLGVSQMLVSLGVDPTEDIKEAEASIMAGARKLDYFRKRMEDWVERTMTRVLAERTGAIQTVAGLGTWYVPLAVWHGKNYRDEAQGHTVMGVAYARRLVEEGRAAECQAAADKFYPWCLDIFGGVDTPNERKYLETGVKTLTNNQTRKLWIRSLERDMKALLQPRDLKGLISVGDALDAVEGGYRGIAERPSFNQLRQRLFADDRRLTLHPGGCLNLNASGVHVHYERFRFTEGKQEYTEVGRRVTVLYDAETAELDAIILGNIPLFAFEDDHAFATETSITSGVGTTLLARTDVERATILGTGRQARRHLQVLSTIRPHLRTVKVYSPNPEHVQEFCAAMSPHVAPLQLLAAESAEDAVREAEVIVTATNSNVPVLRGQWLLPGAHVTSIVGSNKELVSEGSVRQKRRELDDDVLTRASVIVATHRDQAIQDEQGDLFDLVQSGQLTWDGVSSLADVLAGQAEGRTSPQQITVFKQNGDQGATYLALARRCVERARELQRGTELGAA